MADVPHDVSILDQILHSSYPDDVSKDGLLPSSSLEGMLTDELNDVDLDFLLQNDHSLNSFRITDHVTDHITNDQILPEVLSYSTPPYSPETKNVELLHTFQTLPSSYANSLPVSAGCTTSSASLLGLEDFDFTSSDVQAPPLNPLPSYQWVQSLINTPASTDSASSGMEGPSPASPAGSVASSTSTSTSKADISKIEATLNQISCNNGMPSLDVKKLKASLKREERLRKNRETSSLSRQRRKEYLQSLQDSLQEAASKNSLLLQENGLLRKKVHVLEEENSRLKAGSSSAPPVAASPQSSSSGSGRVAVMVIVAMVVFSAGLLPTRTSLFGPASVDPSVVGTAVVPLPPGHGRRLLTVPAPSHLSTHLATDVSLSSRALVVRKASLRAGGREGAGSLHSVVLQGPPKALQPPTVVKQAISVNQSLEVQMHKCFKVWKKQQEKKPLTSVSTVVLESCKRLLSQLPSDHYYELMERSGVGPDLGKTFQTQTPLEMFAESFQRDLDKYYIISLKDHLLLQASQIANGTTAPRLSVIVPSYNATSRKGSLPLVQIDCSVQGVTQLQWDYRHPS